MIEKIYDRKDKVWDITISGQIQYDISIEGGICMGGKPHFRCHCDLEMLKNETGEGFPNDVSLDVGMVSDQHFIEFIQVFRSHRRKNIKICYSLYRKPLDGHEKIIKAHFTTNKYDIFAFYSEMKPKENIYDKILKDVGLLSLYTRDMTDEEIEQSQLETEEEEE